MDRSSHGSGGGGISCAPCASSVSIMAWYRALPLMSVNLGSKILVAKVNGDPCADTQLTSAPFCIIGSTASALPLATASCRALPIFSVTLLTSAPCCKRSPIKDRLPLVVSPAAIIRGVLPEWS